MSKGAAIRRAERRLKKAEERVAQANYEMQEALMEASADHGALPTEDPEFKKANDAWLVASANSATCFDALQRRRWARGRQSA